jgi:hypothetical protein
MAAFRDPKGTVHVAGARKPPREQYVNAPHKDARVLELTAETWTLEVYRTIIQTLQSIAWMLLVVFAVALIAFVILRAFEIRRNFSAAKTGEDDA